MVKDEDNGDNVQEDQTSEHSLRQSTGSQDYQSDKDEMIEISAYNNNNWYDCVSDTEHMYAIGETDHISTTKTQEKGLAKDTDKAC